MIRDELSKVGGDFRRTITSGVGSCGSGGCAGLAFWRFVSGRDLAAYFLPHNP